MLKRISSRLVSSRLVSSRLVSSRLVSSRLAVAEFVLVVGLVGNTQAQSYFSGDLNLDGQVNIADVQCASLVNVAILYGAYPPPGCLDVPTSTVDVNCSNGIDVSDPQLLLLVATNSTATIQGYHDKDYYANWGFLHHNCQRDARGGALDWQCPYTFGHHTGVACAGDTSCALDDQGRAWCWGSDDVGALGNMAVTGDTNSPRLSIRQGAYSKLVGSGKSSNSDDAYCGISLVDGTLWCWGESGSVSKRVGVGSSQATFAGPHRIGTSSDVWTDVAIGREHACAIKDTSPRTLWCWGANDNGQLGIGSVGGGPFAPQLVPHPTSYSSDWASVSAGNDVTCAILADDSGWCWGRNNYGQVGNANRNDGQVEDPTEIDGSYDWASLATYHEVTCGITTSGDLYCWGYGGTSSSPTGQLGVGTAPTCTDSNQDTCCTGSLICTSVPWAVDASSTYTEIAVGGRHACGRTSSPSVRLKCWGDNGVGQLGLGSTGGNETSPQEVDSDTTWQNVTLGDQHGCAIKLVGGGPSTDLYCWGEGGEGQIGDGNTTDRNVPFEVEAFAQSCACGDSSCDDYEDSLVCYPDCGSCGDAVCAPASEDPSSCSADCGCGDGLCQGTEDSTSCSADCGSCGDATCQTNEVAASCPADCGYCGDGLCYGSETTSNCGVDCQCGDTICQSGESVGSCPEDCGYCGDSDCAGPENGTNCPDDC